VKTPTPHFTAAYAAAVRDVISKIDTFKSVFDRTRDTIPRELTDKGTIIIGTGEYLAPFSHWDGKRDSLPANVLTSIRFNDAHTHAFRSHIDDAVRSFLTNTPKGFDPKSNTDLVGAARVIYTPHTIGSNNYPTPGILYDTIFSMARNSR
jgi:hypothetical protein